LAKTLAAFSAAAIARGLETMSVIPVFDGGASALFDGRIDVDRFPDATGHAVVLATALAV